jgi:hypothetical protein
VPQVGRVSEPGRYLFTFGWFTIAESDLAIEARFPNEEFALYATARHHGPAQEFRQGTFDWVEDQPASEKRAEPPEPADR